MLGCGGGKSSRLLNGGAVLPYSEFSRAGRNYAKQSWPEKLASSSLEDYAFVTNTFGDALTIQVLKQRDRVLAAYAREVFESGDIYLGTFHFLSSERAAQLIESRTMEYQV